MTDKSIPADKTTNISYAVVKQKINDSISGIDYLTYANEFPGNSIDEAIFLDDLLDEVSKTGSGLVSLDWLTQFEQIQEDIVGMIRWRQRSFELETSLLSDVIDTTFAEKSESARKEIAQASHLADLKVSSKKKEASDPVSDLFRSEKDNRILRAVFRNVKGHPMNLGEQIAECRKLYKNLLIRVLARAQLIRVVLNHNYVCKVPKIEEKIQADGVVAGCTLWASETELEIERLTNSLKWNTVYVMLYEMRKIGANNKTMSEALNSPDGVNTAFDIEDLIKIDSKKFATVIDSIGIILAIDDKDLPVNEEKASARSAYINAARLLSRQYSFTASVNFDAQSIESEGATIEVKSHSELFDGIGLWGPGSGSLATAVSLRQGNGISGRKATGKVSINISDTSYVNWGSEKRNSIQRFGNTPWKDVVVAVRYGVRARDT